MKAIKTILNSMFTWGFLSLFWFGLTIFSIIGKWFGMDIEQDSYQYPMIMACITYIVFHLTEKERKYDIFIREIEKITEELEEGEE